MLISKYSAPDFDPYGDQAPEEPDALWAAPTAVAPLRARLGLPGSKSITNRELVLAALADGPSLLRAPLHSKDSANMVGALRALGVRIEEREGSGAFGADWLVTPGELIGSTTIDCGQAGTVMRFVPPVAALGLGPTVFDADDSARGRPMGGIVNALRALGVDIDDAGRGGLPFTVHGTGRVAGGAIEIDASASSQFVSALLLSAASFDDGLHLTHVGERLPSLPHIEMTIDALAQRGVTVQSPRVGEWIVAPGAIAARDVDIEPDLSNAAPFLAAALVTGGSVTITGWPDATTQVGADLAGILPAFGATVELSDGALTVRGGDGIHGSDLDLTTGGELAPTVAGLAALADTPSTITGIGHIRHHETDRLAALVAEINALGGEAEELDDGLRITPRPLHGGVWHSYDDHRMSTTGAVIGLAVEGVQVENVEATHKTLPQFTTLWRDLVAGSSGTPDAIAS
ncbi:3-phosphoshikimate 1-carboxyvinyltransferase [Humibacter ginsenosidimutans]|uniref:3-phosphoshikimate 1-carboxyvinyltransferase n=1 Tax=Humibacter ginsenosidimutans TaxID=2599293 RepID=A0A5B8M9Z1_9MICO|nr:3-phosphoshikimate 1-carboxyvinyltransferase [Humibacter ginsenosidimutans]QDZ16482.1 3-phosphoshikimate 1-carboxyvinyltransferase [Humibacter ginsenosidimutans]